MVGDRYLTDVVYGNRNGMLSVCVAPIQLAGETAAVKLVRSAGHNPQEGVVRFGRIAQALCAVSGEGAGMVAVSAETDGHM